MSPLKAFWVSLVVWASAGSLLAQTCSMCKQTAEASGASNVLNWAIFVLLVPSLGLMAGIVVIAYRKRK